MALLELEGIGKSYILPDGQTLHILNNLDLSIGAGSVTAIVGRSGSGKSTLLNLLGLLDMPSAGRMTINDSDVAKLGDARRAKLRGSFLGFVFQQFHLLDRRSALENVAEPMLYAGRSEIGDRFRQARSLLDLVGLADRADSMPHLLSGGEQQRVAIARALIRKPSIVLADEPTGSLDAVNGERILELLLGLVRSQALSLVLVTHDPELASRADRVFVLRDGLLHEKAGA